MADSGTYHIEAHDAREVGATTDYVECARDGKRAYVEFNCPTCQHSITADELVKEGGATCPGCERNVRLHISSHNQFGEWRNIPKGAEEVFR